MTATLDVTTAAATHFNNVTIVSADNYQPGSTLTLYHSDPVYSVNVAITRNT